MKEPVQYNKSVVRKYPSSSKKKNIKKNPLDLQTISTFPHKTSRKQVLMPCEEIFKNNAANIFLGANQTC